MPPENREAAASFYAARHSLYGPAPGADNAHARIPALVGTARRVLDVGCGAGNLGAILEAAGCTVVGIELAPAAAQQARQRLDQVLTGSIDDPRLQLPAGPFDVIVCADILEHLFDPAAALERLVPLLAPAGRLVVSLPNVAHFSLRLELLRGRWEYQDIGLLDRGHLRFYTRASAIRLLQGARLDVTLADIALSIPHASRPLRRIIDLCRRMPRRWQHRLAPLVAAQFILVATPSRRSSEGLRTDESPAC